MLLSGVGIKKALDTGVWEAWRGDTPIGSSDLRIGTNSVNVSLSRRLLFPVVHPHHGVDPVEPELGDNLRWSPVDGEKLLLKAGAFCLGAAQERFDCSTPLWIRKTMSSGPIMERMFFAPMFEGRSTCGRLGIATHVTAGFGDYGFDAPFTMEIYNVTAHDIILTAGMQIAQLNFTAVTPDVADMPRYAGAYAGLMGGPHAPVLGKDRFFD